MATAIGYPLGPGIKRVAWWAAEEALWLVGSRLLEQEDFSQELKWRRLCAVWDRSEGTTVEDVAICTFDILNVTGALIDDSWTDADYTTVEGHFNTWWTTVKAKVAATHVLKEWRWYAMAYEDPMRVDKRFADTGPPVRITPVGIAGADTGEPMPYQIALCITERTAWPRHSGRFYLPGPTEAASSSVGQFNFSYIDTVMNATDVLYTALKGAQFPVIVPVTQVDNVLQAELLMVTQVEADTSPDVQRKRKALRGAERHVAPI